MNVPCEALIQPYYYYSNMFQSPNVTEHDDRAECGGWAAPQALSRVPEEGGQEEGEAFPHQPRGGGEGDVLIVMILIIMMMQGVFMCEDVNCPWPFNDKNIQEFVVSLKSNK